MKKYLKFLFPALAVILIVFTLAACGGETPEPVYHDVYFDLDGGEFHTNYVRVREGDFISVAGAPTKNGHTFAGWYLGDTAYSLVTPVTSSITVKAKWEKVFYTVTFDTDGGTAVDPVKVGYGEKITAPEVTKEYSVLDKWYNGGSIWDFENNTVTSNITLRASWKKEQVTVTFDKNYDASNKIYETTVAKGDRISAPNSSRYGYEVEGWYTEQGEKWDFNTPVTESMTLIANWQVASYEVTFDFGGQGNPDEQTVVPVAHGSYLTEPEIPTKNGYVFAGWYWDMEFSRTNLKNFNEQVYRSFTLYAKWVENKATEGVVYTVDVSGDFASVTGYTGTATDVVIASTYEGVPVKCISSYALQNKRIEFIYIPSSVTSIEEYAFSDCDLFSVTIGDNSALEAIGQYAFSNCDYLVRLSFGRDSSLREIGKQAFYYCKALSCLTLPSGVESVATDAFESCGAVTLFEWNGAYYIGTSENPYFYLFKAKNKEITEFSIHEDTRIIASRAFSGCSKITSITIPEGVRAIGVLAFENCSSVTEIHYNAKAAEDVETFSDLGAFKVGTKTGGATLYVGGNVTRIPANMFAYSGKITEVVFLNTQLGPDEFSTENVALKSIGNSAFRGCSYLTSFELTNGLEEIGESAFLGCVRLAYVLNKTHIASGFDVKVGSRDYGEVALHAMLVTDGGNSPIVKTEDGFVFFRYDKKYLISYEGTADSLILQRYYNGEAYVIREYAFANLTTEFSSVIIPEGITEIPTFCFMGTEIKSVTVSNTVKLIGSYAFSATHLEEIIFESGCTLEEIQEMAFNAVSLEKFVIPKSVKRLGNNIISYSGGSLTVTFEDGSEIEFVLSGTFQSCKDNNFTVDSYGGKYIGSASNPYLVLIGFTGSAPKSYTVADGARIIARESGSYSFNSIKELTLPASIIDVPYLSISSTPSITLNLADMAQLNRLVKSIAAHGGENRFILTGAKVINVGGEPLRNLVIEEGVTEIYAELFRGVESIETISLPSTLTKIGSNAFADCVNVKEITLPEGLSSADLSSMSGLENVYIASRNAYVKIHNTEVTLTVGKTVEILNGSFAGVVSVIFEEGAIVSEIGEAAFKDSQIKAITIPTTVEKIGKNAFSGSMIKEITIPGSIKTISEGAFYECGRLEKVIMSDGVEVIESNAFGKLAYNSDFTEITLPSTLLRIEANAFSAYSISESVRIANYIPSSCYFVAKGAFGNRVTGLDTAFYYGAWYYLDESGNLVWLQHSPENYTDEYDLYRKNVHITFVDEGGNAIAEAEVSLRIDGDEAAKTFTTDAAGNIRFNHDPKVETVIVIVACPEGYEIPTEPITFTGTENTVTLKAKV